MLESLESKSWIVILSQLPNVEEIAINRLSKNSGQGVEEFKNVVKVIAKLHTQESGETSRLLHSWRRANANLCMLAKQKPGHISFWQVFLFVDCRIYH